MSPKTDRFVDQMPLSSLVAPEWNRDIGDVTDLAESLKAKGVLQAILVTPRGKKFLVADGNRRWAAAKLAGMTHIPAVVRDMTDEEALECIVVANCQRKDISPVEEARALQRLADIGRTQRAIAEKIGTSQAHVAKRLALLKLPAEVLTKVDAGAVTLADAALLGELVDHPKHLAKVVALGGNVAYGIQRAKQEIKAEETAKATRLAAKAQGWPVVKSADKWGFRPPEGTWAIGTEWGALDLDAKAHTTEPCHAIGIEPQTGKAVPCCTDRSRHPNAKTRGEQQAGGAERAASVEERQRAQAEWDSARARRLEVAAGMARAVSERTALGLAASSAIKRCPEKMVARALALFGLATPEGIAKEDWQRTPEERELCSAAVLELEREVNTNIRRAVQFLWLATAAEVEAVYDDPGRYGLEEEKGDLGRYVRALIAEGAYVPLPREREFFGIAPEKKVKAKPTELANA